MQPSLLSRTNRRAQQQITPYTRPLGEPSVVHSSSSLITKKCLRLKLASPVVNSLNSTILNNNSHHHLKVVATTWQSRITAISIRKRIAASLQCRSSSAPQHPRLITQIGPSTFRPHKTIAKLITISKWPRRQLSHSSETQRMVVKIHSKNSRMRSLRRHRPWLPVTRARQPRTR